jgi:hypothetical protein
MSEPLTGIGEVVLRLWREALDVADAGPDDDFFELGGDSLAATLLAVFDNPTPAALTLELELQQAGAEARK